MRNQDKEAIADDLQTIVQARERHEDKGEPRQWPLSAKLWVIRGGDFGGIVLRQGMKSIISACGWTELLPIACRRSWITLHSSGTDKSSKVVNRSFQSALSVVYRGGGGGRRHAANPAKTWESKGNEE